MDDIQVPDKLAWQQNRRRIAYIATLTMVATGIASFVFPEREKEIPAMDVLFFSLLSGNFSTPIANFILSSVVPLTIYFLLKNLVAALTPKELATITPKDY